MLNFLENLAKVAVDFYISQNPCRARIIADDKGIDYDTCVKSFFLEKFKEKETTENEWNEKNFPIEAILETINSFGGFLVFMSAQLESLSEQKLRYVLTQLPALFDFYRDEIFSIMIFKIKDLWHLIHVLKENEIYIFPEDLNKYFNAHRKENSLSMTENVKIARRIAAQFSTTKPVFDAEITKCMRVEVLKEYKIKAFSKDCKYFYLFEDLNFSENRILVGTAINHLINELHYVEAADLATDFGGEHNKLHFECLQGVAAGLAYKRCYDNNQYKEAAEISLKYGIGDFRGAAEKELERMEKMDGERSSGDHCRFTMVAWAVKFDLALREDQVYGYIKHIHTPENLLKVGCLSRAREMAIHLLHDNFDPSLEKYFYPGTSYFDNEEALAWAVKRLLYNREFQFGVYEDLFVKDEYTQTSFKIWNKKSLLDAFLIQWMLLANKIEFVNIKNLARSVINSPNNPVNVDLADLALQASQIMLEKKDWSAYRRICKEWLPKRYTEVLEIDNSKVE
jgi:hypothetical protein